MIDRAIG